jgi:hypothetical protein
VGVGRGSPPRAAFGDFVPVVTVALCDDEPPPQPAEPAATAASSRTQRNNRRQGLAPPLHDPLESISSFADTPLPLGSRVDRRPSSHAWSRRSEFGAA